jgi:membrane protein DedA with SNARE-associated domain
VKLFKFLLLITLPVLFLEVISEGSGNSFSGDFNRIFIVSQDTTKKSIFEPQIPDSNKIRKDSLEKLVPYLDRVDANSGNDLMVVYMFLIMFSTLFSEDLACIGAGLMVANGMIAFWPAAIAALSGIFIGDFTLYFAGRFLGTSIFNIAPFKWMVKKENVYSAEAWFERKGPIILVLSRFIPGSRFPVYLSAGILKTSFWKFVIYFGLTALIWTPVFVWFSVFAGGELLIFYESYEDYALWTIVGAIAFLVLFLRYLIPMLKAKLKSEL